MRVEASAARRAAPRAACAPVFRLRPPACVWLAAVGILILAARGASAAATADAALPLWVAALSTDATLAGTQLLRSEQGSSQERPLMAVGGDLSRPSVSVGSGYSTRFMTAPLEVQQSGAQTAFVAVTDCKAGSPVWLNLLHGTGDAHVTAIGVSDVPAGVFVVGTFDGPTLSLGIDDPNDESDTRSTITIVRACGRLRPPATDCGRAQAHAAA